jgi:hypothetical protein
MVLALLLGGAGVTLLMVDSFQAYARAPLGLAVGLLSAVGWAIGTLILQRGRVQVPVLVLTAWQLLIGAVPMTAGALLFGDGQLVHAQLADGGHHRLDHAGADVHRQLLLVRDRRAVAGPIAGLSSVMVPVVAMISGARSSTASR